MSGRARRRVLLPLAAALVVPLTVAACTTSAATSPRSTTPTGSASSSGRTTSDAARSPAAVATTFPSVPAGRISRCGTYAAPDPNRPRMSVDFTVAADHRTVRGTETIRFRPDLPVSELVFLLAANARETVEGGNRMVVTSATADHGARTARYTRANAAPGTQGGLLHIPFGRRLPAGTVITARLAFTVTLGKPYFDRFGRSGDFAYFGTAQPLLTWQRGVGWHEEPLATVSGESATSEAMDVDLTVHAPGRDTVVMSGDPTTPAASTGYRTWHAHLAAARDVSVAVGPFVMADQLVGGIRLHVGAPSTGLRDQSLHYVARAIGLLTRLFGPFPFPSLSVARLPVNGGGIEYPSSIFLDNGGSGDDRRNIAVHETAHQWFYALVGNSQDLHPWLDEAFATYAEDIADDEPARPADLRIKGDVGASTFSFGPNDDIRYFDVVYSKGAAALRAARDAAGHTAWDDTLRCYIAHHAWRIVVPRDVQDAIARYPRAVAVLRRAGALP